MLHRLLFICYFLIGVSSIALLTITAASVEISVSTSEGVDVEECLHNESLPCKTLSYAMVGVQERISTSIVLLDSYYELNDGAKTTFTGLNQLKIETSFYFIKVLSLFN